MTTRLDLVFAEKNTLPMDLLERNVCRGEVIVVDSVLVKRVHRRVCAGPPLIESLLGHYSLAGLLLGTLQVGTIVGPYLEIGRYVIITGLAIILLSNRFPLTVGSVRD